MALPTRTVTCLLFDQQGATAANARIRFTLSAPEIVNGIVAPEMIEKEADANGVATFDLVPNILGVNGTQYLVKAWNPDTGKKFIDGVCTVPDENCFLHDILMSDPPPTIDAAQRAVAAAQAYAIQAGRTVPVFAATAPTDPINGAQWISTITGRRFTWIVDEDSSQWVEFGTASASSAEGLAVDLASNSGAGMVSFLGDGVGAAPMTVDRFNQDFVSVSPFVAGDAPGADNTASVQRAIDHALEVGKGLFLPPRSSLRIDGTLYFNSAITYDASTTVKPFWIIGFGATIVKTTSGYIFNRYHSTTIGGGANKQFNLLRVLGVNFESEIGAGAVVMNANRFYRVDFSGCQFSKIDGVARALDPDISDENPALSYSGSTGVYMQSVYFHACNFQRGSGWAIDTPRAFDILVSASKIEHRQHFWRISSGTFDPAANTCRLIDSVVEGLSGNAIAWGACFASKISGNYMEANGGYIDLSLNTTPFHKGIEVSNNSFTLTTAQIAAGLFPVVWGKASGSAKAGGNVSNGNLHDATLMAAYLDATGDVVYGSGEIIKGWKGVRSTETSATGYGAFFEGGRVIFDVLSRHVEIDPFNSGMAFSQYSSTVSGSKIPTGIYFGTVNPAVTPSAYGSRAWAIGTIVINPQSVEAGVANGKYIQLGWKCVAAGTGGNAGTDRWVELRVPTDYRNQNSLAAPGDANAFPVNAVSATVIFDAPITANRSVNFSGLSVAGDSCRVARASTATGAFNVTVAHAGGTKNVGAGTFADFVFNGTAWALTGSGSIA